MTELSRRNLIKLAGASLPLLYLGSGGHVLAESHNDTLRYITGGAFNTLDPIGVGASADSVVLGASIYDRLVRFDRAPTDNKGSYVFDYNNIRGELAERYDVSQDGLTYTFHLRSEATFHDGRPVTAEDVKWSLDRAVVANVTGRAQLQTGSLTDPKQFSVVDPLTFQIKLEKADRLVLPNLASMFAPIYNSKLVRENVPADQPWGEAWLQNNTAGGGAYKVQSYKQGQQLVLVRHDGWKSSTLPAFPRVIIQTIPEAATRANLISRGDADITLNLLPETFATLRKNEAVKTIAEPMPGGIAYLIFNTKQVPFDDVRVRKAISLAVPYDNLFAIGASGQGAPLFGAKWEKEPDTAEYPQALPWRTDVEEAKRQLAAAGYPNGFTTKLHYNTNKAAFAASPAALLQEALAKVGITIEIEPLPDAQWAEATSNKRLPLMIDRSFSMFPAADYFFRIFFLGGQRWNLSQWDNAEVSEILPKARFETDPEKYAAYAKRLISLVYQEAPAILLWRPTQEVVTAASIRGFTTWFHNLVDPRDLARMS
ncbi:ABC transporter substrate-binding protein [Agrobacterium rhizogenes]|nr:ABC transporter substrate-binding protein [Rhizobium rhizogenes]NTG32221.1 ABC transporter substrate-binding protein [Rhizobium rhizogenes]